MGFEKFFENKQLLEKEISEAVQKALKEMGEKSLKIDWLVGNEKNNGSVA